MQLTFNFEEPKLEKKIVEVVKTKPPKKGRKSKMDTKYLGKYCETTEGKALKTLQHNNPDLEFKPHSKVGNEKKKQDGDIYKNGELIAYVEVQTHNKPFDNFYDNWDFYQRRTEKKYDKPCLIAFQDPNGEILLMGQGKYIDKFKTCQNKELDIRGTDTSKGADALARRMNWHVAHRENSEFEEFRNTSRNEKTVNKVENWITTGKFNGK